tara:strand:+ start:582 stop:1193 length:612 start_codon:yes stop_codon:yes gene_type:complete
MTLLGLDFDNTLVRYDKLFHQLALEKGLIKASLPAYKLTIRDYLRKRGQDEEFTILQGEVYGKRILEAEPAEGMLETLKELKRLNIPMVLISHKTRNPYKGPKYDLHKSAISWLEKYNFFSKDGLDWSMNNLSFQSTKELKVEKIHEMRCTHYIDDLPDILNMISSKVSRILYDPERMHSKNQGYKIINEWKEIRQKLTLSNE